MILNIVVHLVSEWETFHRRPMLEALAQNATGQASILCINPTVTPALRPKYWMKSARKWRWAKAGVQQVAANLYVYTPTCWVHPLLTRHGRGKALYRKSVSRQILQVLALLRMEAGVRVAWVFRPEQIELLGLAQEKYVVYECYDEYQLDRRWGQFLPKVKADELSLLARSDVVFTTSQSLFDKRIQWHSKTYIIPNGVNDEIFRQALGDARLSPELMTIRRPIIGFIGHLGDSTDYTLLEYIADSHPEWSVVLVGPVIDETCVKSLRQKRNVYFLGWRPYRDLPYLLKGFDVAIIPDLVNDYAAYSEPLRMWEYLAAAKVAVSTDLREVRRYSNIILVAGTRDEFVRAIEQALAGSNEERIRQGQEAARKRSWEILTKHSVDILVKEFLSSSQLRNEPGSDLSRLDTAETH